MFSSFVGNWYTKSPIFSNSIKGISLDRLEGYRPMKSVHQKGNNGYEISFPGQNYRDIISCHRNLTYWSLWDVANNLKLSYLHRRFKLSSWAFLEELLSGECHRTPMVRSQHCAIIAQDIWRYMASLGHKKLTVFDIAYMYGMVK